MNIVELFTVEDSFQVEREVILIPDFPVPDSWEDRTETVIVVKPNGQEYDATARLSMSHFNYRDPKISIDKRWRVVIRLLNRKKEDVPVGSKILVSRKVGEAILPRKSV